MATTPFKGRNGLQTDAYIAAGANAVLITNTGITVGSNVTVNTSTLMIGNSVVNSYITSTTIKVGSVIISNATHANINNLIVTGTVTDATANVVNQTLTDGATINWNAANGRIASVTLNGNRTMAAPTNLKIGVYVLHVLQDASVGGRTLTWNSVFKWTAGVAPVLTTNTNARDIFSFICDGTNLYGSFMPDVK